MKKIIFLILGIFVVLTIYSINQISHQSKISTSKTKIVNGKTQATDEENLESEIDGKKVNMGEVEDLLTNLSDETNFDFGESQDTQFVWRVEGEKVGKVRNIIKIDVRGKKVSIKNLPNIDLATGVASSLIIQNYFQGLEFLADKYNLAAGTISNTTGYQNGKLVCLIEDQIAGGIDGLKSKIVKSNFEISCGMLK
jgi:hypothetical protein